MGVITLGINPFFTFVLCLVPRVLCGWLAGLVFQFLGRFDKTQLWSLPVCGFLTAALNTVFFVSTMMLLFGSSDYIMGMQAGAPLLTFLASFVGVNGLIEIAVCTIVSAALVKPVLALRKKGKI